LLSDVKRSNRACLARWLRSRARLRVDVSASVAHMLERGSTKAQLFSFINGSTRREAQAGSCFP
jgi:hypothetical protein